MMQNLLILLILLTMLTFIQLQHPLALGLTLLIQTTLVCLISSFLNETYWFSYILFLVFMGGMLVLFIYVTSLASNETFSLSINVIISAMLIISFMIPLLLYDNMLTNEFFSTTFNNINKENYLNLIKLFNYPTNLITILLMNYLLITLIAVVKLTNIFYGPLRQMFN